MKHALLALAIAALALPASALGKGPSAASIDGPGSGGGITVSGDGESGGTQLGDLAQQAGFFEAAFGQEPNPLPATRPNGNLGQKYTITYTVPGPNNELDEIHQDVYRYANPAPVTYMEPGQAFFGTERTRGGWFQGDASLKQTLVEVGLRSSAPVSASASGSRDFPATVLSLLAASLLVAMATALLIRRRARPAAA